MYDKEKVVGVVFGDNVPKEVEGYSNSTGDDTFPIALCADDIVIISNLGFKYLFNFGAGYPHWECNIFSEINWEELMEDPSRLDVSFFDDIHTCVIDMEKEINRLELSLEMDNESPLYQDAMDGVECGSANEFFFWRKAYDLYKSSLCHDRVCKDVVSYIFKRQLNKAERLIEDMWSIPTQSELPFSEGVI